MNLLFALVGFLANPGTLMGSPPSSAAGTILQDAIATESDVGLTTESGEFIVTEESSL